MGMMGQPPNPSLITESIKCQQLLVDIKLITSYAVALAALQVEVRVLYGGGFRPNAFKTTFTMQ